MLKPALLGFALVCAFAFPVSGAAQETTATTGESTRQPTAERPATVRGILEAILLPRVTEAAREAGVPEGDIQIVLDESGRQSLPPEETRVLLEETTEAVREQGPIDNFGAFVQARLAEGLRGRDLAAAIRAEHRLRGKGKGHAKERPGGGQGDDHPGQGKGKKGEHVRDGHDEDDHEDESGKGKGKKNGKNKNKGEGGLPR